MGPNKTTKTMTRTSKAVASVQQVIRRVDNPDCRIGQNLTRSQVYKTKSLNLLTKCAFQSSQLTAYQLNYNVTLSSVIEC